MTNIETKDNAGEKLSQKDVLSLVDFSPFPKRDNSKAKKGRIKPRTVKGIVYYYYCRGKDKEKYLGTAENILKAVYFYKRR